jgi:hypothetical protein
MRKRVAKSKRQTCALKYKIRQRASEHKRRVKKESRKSKVNNIIQRKPARISPIPNTFPNKLYLVQEQDLLKEISEIKKVQNNKSKVSRKQKKNKEETPDLVV